MTRDKRYLNDFTPASHSPIKWGVYVSRIKFKIEYHRWLRTMCDKPPQSIHVRVFGKFDNQFQMKNRRRETYKGATYTWMNLHPRHRRSAARRGPA